MSNGATSSVYADAIFGIVLFLEVCLRYNAALSNFLAHPGNRSNYALAEGVDSIMPADKIYHRDQHEHNRQQREKRGKYDEKNGRGVATVVASVAEASPVPFGAHSAICVQDKIVR